MEFCRSALWVLILLIISTGSESDPHVVKVEYKRAAVLPCSERCTGVAIWTPSDKSTDILAECDQTCCRSVKEGYQMIYNQYLQGDFSLNITKVDFSKRGRYTCDCAGKDKCDVELQIEARKTPVQMKSGDSLHLELDVSVSVEVIYYSTGSSGQICKVIEGSLQCEPEYEHRTSLLSSSSVLKLRGVKESDSGVYTVRDTKNKEDIYIYTVTVTDPDAQERMRFMGLMVFVTLIVVSVGVVILLLKKNNKFCFKKSEKADLAQSGDSCNKQNIYCPEKSPLNHQQV